MVSITKAEKEKILKAFPRTKIIRAMKGKSKRHSYMMEENPLLKRYLGQLRKENIVSENGVPVSYPAASPFGRKRQGSKSYPKKNFKNNRNKEEKKFESGQGYKPKPNNHRFGNDQTSRNDFKNSSGYGNSRRPRDSFKPKNGWKTSDNSYGKSKGSSRWDNKNQYKEKTTRKDLWD